MPVGAKARAFLETAQAVETARAAFARGTRAGLPPFPAVFMPESSLLVRRGPRAGARSAAGTDGARASAAEAAVLPFSGAQASLVAPSAGAAPSAVSPSGGIAPSLMAPNSPALAPSGAPATFPPPPGAAAPPSPAFGALPPLTHAAVKTRAARARAQSPLTAARPDAEASAARPARDAGEAQDARAARPAAVASAAAAARMSAGARGIRSTRSAADAARGQSAAPITAGTPGESASAGRALPLPAAQTFGSSASVSAAPAAAFHWKGRAGKALPLAVRAALEHAARRAARGGDAAGTVDAAAPVPPGVPLTLRDISARHPAPLRYHTVAQKPAARAAQPDRPAAGAPGAAFPRGSAAAGRMQAEQAAASDPRPDSGPVQAAEAAALRHRGGGTARTGGAFSAGRASAPAAADAGTPAENDPAAAPRASVFPPGRIQPGAQEGLRFAWPARGPYHLSAWSLSERPAAATALRHIALARAARAMVRRAGAPGTPSGVPAPAALRSAAVRAQMAAAFVASDASLPLVAPGQPLAYARTPSLPLAQEEPLTLARRASPPPPVPPQTQAAELPPPPSPAPPPPTEHLLPTRPPEQTAPPKVDVEQIARQVIVRVQQEMRLERMRLGRV